MYSINFGCHLIWSRFVGVGQDAQFVCICGGLLSHTDAGAHLVCVHTGVHNYV